VICARVSPKQKARVVEMVRRARPGIVTLAIGDGANDVPMIQTANVGIGIFGLEGKQAVMSADYAVGQFRFLKPLLLVHGRWQYRRIAKVIVYMYYKSAVQVLPNFWFGFVTLFSGQFMYYDLMYQTYNAFYTFTPILIFALFDQDASAETALSTPTLYLDGIKCVHHSTLIFWAWMCEAGVHSVAITLIPSLSLQYGEILEYGKAAGVYDYGLIIFFSVIVVVTVRLMFELKMVTLLATFFMAISLILWWISWLIYSGLLEVGSFEGFRGVGFIHGSYDMMAGSATFWMQVILMIAVCASTSLLYEGYSSSFKPSAALVAREIEKRHNRDVRRNEAA